MKVRKLILRKMMHQAYIKEADRLWFDKPLTDRQVEDIVNSSAELWMINAVPEDCDVMMESIRRNHVKVNLWMGDDYKRAKNVEDLIEYKASCISKGGS
jgi:hypothetical protein